jgi:hypothetical protein
MLDKLFNKNMFVRRFTLLFVLALTAYAYKWGFDYVMISEKTGADIAMILGALLGPLTTLQGFIFKFYSDARNVMMGLEK